MKCQTHEKAVNEQRKSEWIKWKNSEDSADKAGQQESREKKRGRGKDQSNKEDFICSKHAKYLLEIIILNQSWAQKM